MWMLKRKEQAATQTRTEPAPIQPPDPSFADAPIVGTSAPSGNSIIKAAANTGQALVKPAATLPQTSLSTTSPSQPTPRPASTQVATAPVRLGVSPVTPAASSTRLAGIAVAPPGGNPGLGAGRNDVPSEALAPRPAALEAAGKPNLPAQAAPVVPIAQSRAPAMSLEADTAADLQSDSSPPSNPPANNDPGKLTETGDGAPPPGGGTPPGGPSAPGGPLIGISDATVETFAAAALGQVVSMLGEDTRTYLQGMEQIYTAAAGKALAMIAKGGADQEIGIKLLTQIQTSQTQTTTFATDIASVAKQFVSIKGG